MRFEDGPQLPLTPRKKVLLGIGAAMCAAQIIAAMAAAPLTTGEDAANAAAIGLMWLFSIPWSVAAVLLIVRQADLPDVATGSFLVTISAYAIYALTAALNARGTSAEVDVVDAIFLGVTVGALTALVVWGIAMGVARLLRLPTSAQAEGG
jgi:hypothetical protein